jgi:hypothetical protein
MFLAAASESTPNPSTFASKSTRQTNTPKHTTTEGKFKHNSKFNIILAAPSTHAQSTPKEETGK